MRAIHIHLLILLGAALVGTYFMLKSMTKDTDLFDVLKTNATDIDTSTTIIHETHDDPAYETYDDPTYDIHDDFSYGSISDNSSMGNGTLADEWEGWEEIFDPEMPPHVNHKTWHDEVLVDDVTFWGDDAHEQLKRHLEGQDLEKRTRTPWTVQMMDDDELCAYMKNGRDHLTTWMLEDINQVDQMITQLHGPDPLGSNYQREDLARCFPQGARYWSYKHYTRDVNLPTTLGPIANALKSLHVGTDVHLQAARPWNLRRLVNLAVQPDGPNGPLRWIQDKKYQEVNTDGDHVEHQATGGVYDSVYNIVDGVIVVQAAYGPAYMEQQNSGTRIELPDHELPALRQWSDLTWYGWLQCRAKNAPFPIGYWQGFLAAEGRNAKLSTTAQMNSPAMKAWINFIVIQRISQPVETLQIIQSCIQSRGFRNGRVPDWTHRQTYEIGSWCYYALIATKDSYDIAWLLIQHKTTLGIKAPLSVTIWWSDDNNGPQEYTSYQNLLWKIAPVDQDMRTTQTTRQTDWTEVIGTGAGWDMMAVNCPPIQ